MRIISVNQFIELAPIIQGGDRLIGRLVNGTARQMIGICGGQYMTIYLAMLLQGRFTKY